MQTLTVTMQMHGVLAEHALMVKAVVALAVCLLQSPVWKKHTWRLALPEREL
jgi:simple sugar transport system permease protein